MHITHDCVGLVMSNFHYWTWYCNFSVAHICNVLVILRGHLLFFSSAYYSDICVGSIACRLEKKEGGAVCVYIMTLGVLAPYRGLGIGEHATYPFFIFNVRFVLSLFEKSQHYACWFVSLVSMLVDMTWS